MRLPPKLKAGDEIRVLALSRSLGGAMLQGGFTEDDVAFAVGRLETMGLKVSFGRWVRECNAHLTASPEQRLEDLYEAFASPSVKAILAVTGGIGALQILDGINYELVAAHPKIICGYSDVGYLANAIFARTGVATYYGPNFISFMMRRGADYMLAGFHKSLFDEAAFELHPVEQWSDDAWHKDQVNRTFHINDGWWCIQPGEAEGVIIGGSYWCLNMLQGTKFFPTLCGTVLFLEHPAEGKATLMSLDSALRSLSFQPEFSQVRAIVLGRYAQNGGVTRKNLTDLIRQISALNHLPVIANCDFGHTTPVATLPIGGRCKLRSDAEQSTIAITEH
jgi:muramoyltetrapeptide carboxypeptidase LdcA involved in peptidoglycan recycling